MVTATDETRVHGRHVLTGVPVDAPGKPRKLRPSPQPVPMRQVVAVPAMATLAEIIPIAVAPKRRSSAPVEAVAVAPVESVETIATVTAQDVDVVEAASQEPEAKERQAEAQVATEAAPDAEGTVTTGAVADTVDLSTLEPPQLPAPDVSMRSAVQAPPPPGFESSAAAAPAAPTWLSAVPPEPVRTPIPDPVQLAQPEPVAPGSSLFDNITSAPRPTLPPTFLPEPATAAAPQIVYVQTPAFEAPVFETPVQEPAATAGAPWLNEPVPDFTPTADASEPAFQALPDVSTYRPTLPAPAAHRPAATVQGAKEPIFVWRGKPLGADKEAPKKKRSAPAGGTSDEVIDPQNWFSDTMQHAMDIGASDLHLILDGETHDLTARLRIDGQMRHFKTITGNNASVIMGIFKTAAGFASDGSFAPEESLYSVEVDGEERKARVSLFRTNDGGDALVLRLPPTGPLRSLEDLEFADANLALFHRMLHASNRMILIAGPMGSGKTTTAHAALKLVASPNRTVWSVEDPVERDLEGVIQLEIDDKNGAGFDALLPTLVRADYDTLFLGEIRDKATASAGVRQAKVGRQVITTIHATDNVEAMLRLIELAEDSPLSVLEAVRGIVSQRLVRRLNRDWDGVNPDEKYLGRIPIHEVLIINDELIEAVMRNRPLAEIKAAAASASESTFERDAARLIAAGITDAEEIGRVLGE